MTLPYVTPGKVKGTAPVKQAAPSKPARRSHRAKFPKPSRTSRRPERQGGPSKQLTTDAPRLVQVACRTKHCINGANYGPGVVTVTEDVAAMLREQERRVVEGEDIFYGRRAFVVAPGRRLQPVAWETFSDGAEGKPEIGTAHNSGKFEENK